MALSAIQNQTPATAACELDKIDPIPVDTVMEQPIKPLVVDHTQPDTEKIIVLDDFGSAATGLRHGNLVAGIAAAASQHTERDQVALMQLNTGDLATAANDALQQILKSDTSARVVNLSLGLTPASLMESLGAAPLLATSTHHTAKAVAHTRAAVAEKLGLPHDASSADIKAAMSSADTPTESEWAAFKDAKAAHRALTSTVKALAKQNGLPENASQKAVLTELVNQAEKILDNPAIKKAEQALARTVQALRDKGISVVEAAGNDGIITSQLRALGVPFNADTFNDNVLTQGPIITVGATLASDDPLPAPFTNPSGEVDIAADGMNFTFTNGFTESGTSFAAPVIAGLVADLYAINPALTPDKVDTLLQQAAQANPDAANALGAGLINQYLARELARNA